MEAIREKRVSNKKGDWRNNMIQMAYVDGFKLKNITIQNSHAWAISFGVVTKARPDTPPITYTVDKEITRNVPEVNLIKVPVE